MKKALGTVAALVVALSACGAPTIDESADARGGLSDSIDVTGNWTIDVVDPDGTVVETVEFQNAITNNGWAHLGLILSGERRTTSWQVNLTDYAVQPGRTGCTDCNPAGTATWDGGAGAVVVSASTTPMATGDTGPMPFVIEVVAGRVSWSDGVTTGSRDFSVHTLDTPVTIEPGQSVQIEISYVVG